MRVQNQKLSEEASYAKELASAAAVELKNLAEEVTKLSLQNVKLEKELSASREMLNSRSFSMQSGNGGNRKYGDSVRQSRRGRFSSRANDVNHDDFDTWDLDPEDLKRELQARKQREAALEAVLAEKEIIEDEYRKKFDESKKREAALENDLANMWVLVARLKKENCAGQEAKANDVQNGVDSINDPKVNEVECKDPILNDSQSIDYPTPPPEISKEEPLVARLKVECVLVLSACLFICF